MGHFGRRRDRSFRVNWVNQYAVTPDQPGGTRHHEMASALRIRGYDVRIVASDLNLTSRSYSRRHGATDRRVIVEDVAGVPFAWLPAGVYESNDWRRAFSMAVFACHALLFLLRTTRRGDVVIGSSPQLLAAAAARLAAFLRGGRFVLEVRDLWPESLTGVAGRGSPLAFGLRELANALYRTSHAIVILAEGSRGIIERHGGRPARIVFVPNGVDVDGFERATTELPADMEWIGAQPTFVYAGAHGQANGLDLVVEAAAELQRVDRNDIRVLLIGDGPAKADLQREAAALGLRNLVFHAPVPKSAIPAIMARCSGGLMVLKDVDLFRFGVSPNKLFDYLACDLPVVTNVPGSVADIVEGADAGIVIPPGDPAALAGAMISIAQGDVGSRSGSAYIREHHDRSILADRLAAVIDAVAGSITGGPPRTSARQRIPRR